MTSSDTSNANNTNDPHHTIQDFDLTREPTTWEPKDTSFIDQYLVLTDLIGSPHPPGSPPSAPEWSSYKVTQPRGSSSPRLLNGYAVSPSHHAYVTFCVQLTTPDASARLTTMRYRDMVADNYAAAGADLSRLRWLGVANILRESSRASFARVFRLAGQDILSRGRVEVRPADLSRNEALRRALHDDVFVRGVLSLLRHRARDLGHAVVRRFVLLSAGYEGHEHSGQPSPLELRFDLVVELARAGGDADVAGERTREVLAVLPWA